MTSRQAGRRINTIASQQRRKPKRSGRYTPRRVEKKPIYRREEPISPKERRRLIQLLSCSVVFILLVAAKLLLPAQMVAVREKALEVMQQNMDVQAVFSAVGRAFSGEGDPQNAAEEIYQAVFHPEQTPEIKETVVTVAAEGKPTALELLHTYHTQEEPAVTEEASSLGVLYSDENLPEGVSLEQAILGFAYCTPVQGTLSSSFGYREHPIEGEDSFHYGIDLAADTGTAISCFADGTVGAVGESTSYGKYCIVNHKDGYATLYAHCSRINTSSGAEVKLGEKIAEVGETGMATGPHLHFELHKDGIFLNPIYYVSDISAA